MNLLDSIVTGKKKKPAAVLLSGVHGIGKSTFGANAPSPIFIGSEENDELDSARFPKVEKWSQLIEQLNTLLVNDHNYQTVVIDTVDSLEQIAQKEILAGTDKTMATAMGGYGKAYEKMKDMFLSIRDNYLIPLRDNKGMNIIILCHAEKVKHEDPITNTSYDHFQTSIHKKVKAIFEDWVSCILFANFELYRAENANGKEFLVGQGERRIFTEERPSHVAKNRFNLPYEMKLDFNAVKEGIDKFFGEVEAKGENPEAVELRNQIDGYLTSADAATKKSIELSVKRAKDDVQELTRILNKLMKLVL